MSWLRLIRWSNLLIILLTQLLAWWCLIVPVQQHAPGTLLLTPFNFSLLCLSTVLIAAAGYIINDYFDIRIDAINKPDKVILERQIPRKRAIIVHSVLNVLALLLAGIVAWQARHLEWLLLQAGCTYLLWRYSTTWKRQFMTGNLVVAFMTALTILALVLYEPGLQRFFKKCIFVNPMDASYHLNPLLMLGFFCFFAFILTWMREIVKDMEDYKGDAEEGCITMPIKWGLKRTIHFIRFLGIIASVVIGLSAGAFFYLDAMSKDNFYMTGAMALLFITLLGWLFSIGRRFTAAYFHSISRWLKIIMVLGIGSLVVYHYQYG